MTDFPLHHDPPPAGPRTGVEPAAPGQAGGIRHLPPDYSSRDDGQDFHLLDLPAAESLAVRAAFLVNG